MATDSRTPERLIAVGVDGSGSADRALRWAAHEASRTGAMLRVVNTWSLPVTTWSMMAVAYLDPTDIEAQSRRTVEQAENSVRSKLGASAPEIETRTVRGDPAGGLIDASRDADLLVVGTRGGGGFTRLVRGSVAVSCVHHATCPVAVIGQDAPEPGAGEIVVGLDDSDGAHRALQWAAREATRLGVGLRVVHGGVVADERSGEEAGSDPDAATMAGKALERSVDEQLQQLAEVPTFQTMVVALDGAEALISEAADAALLVVGARGSGGFRALLLGSVSQKVLHHSPCPLVVVPRPTDDG